MSIPLNLSLKEVIKKFGFENPRESRFAEALIDAGSPIEYLDGNTYLIEGCCDGYDGIFFRVYIHWVCGEKPRVRNEREPMV